MNDKDRVIQAIAGQSGMRASQVRRNYTLDFFTFVINFLPLAASNTDTQNFITQADSGFAIVKTSFEVASNVNVFVANISDTPRYATQVITLRRSSGRTPTHLSGRAQRFLTPTARLPLGFRTWWRLRLTFGCRSMAIRFSEMFSSSAQ